MQLITLLTDILVVAMHVPVERKHLVFNSPPLSSPSFDLEAHVDREVQGGASQRESLFCRILYATMNDA